MKAPATGVFRSLRKFNYRVWIAGAFVSNIGTWVQRTAQDWLVFTQLTDHDASAVGLVMALQFGPQILLLPWTGFAADHFNQRRLLMVTQAAMGVLALALGILTVTGPRPAPSARLAMSSPSSVRQQPPPSTRRRGRLSSPIWWAMRICTMRWRSTRPRSMARA